MSLLDTTERPRSGSLADRITQPGQQVLLTFAGQGWRWWDDVEEQLAHRADLVTRAQRWSSMIAELQSEPHLRDNGQMVDLDVVGWHSGTRARPSAGALSLPQASLPGCLLTQLLTWHSLCLDGLADAVGAGSISAATGHSAGVLGAAAIAQRPDGDFDDDFVHGWMHLALILGDELAASPDAVGADRLDAAARGDGDAAVPMIAISGVRVDRLADQLAEVAPRVRVALRHSAFRAVISGPPQDLVIVRAELGDVGWEPLTVGVAAHNPILGSTADRVMARLKSNDLFVDSAAFVFPVVSVHDSRPYAGECSAELVRDILERPGQWDQTLLALEQDSCDDGEFWVLDVGPSDGVARMAAAALRGTRARVVALGTVTGRRQLLTAGAIPALGRTYREYLPRVVCLPDGTQRIENRFTLATGRSPMVLPGMTPTTVDAPIVAAAANGGYLAELAGGGQVSERIFELRIEELTELLEPGQEIVFNALHLDPYLWNLHLGRDRLVQNARAAGAPICGVTVSAGIPELDEAVALLDDLAELGMWCNAFKPGTVDQIRQVLDIARAAPDHTVFIHVEGGTAGGHHSWEDLEDLLLRTYHDIRATPNVVLCVGGGVGTSERSAELLRGTWAQRHGSIALPVDALLIGTAAMACAEATATQQVKESLRDAPGGSGFVEQGAVSGDVTSGRSGLNADIHFLDNHASRCAALLDEVAGDADAVRARRSEIATALALTAKPWFGELNEMTYAALLRRFVELTALGQGGRYDDGVWLDPTHRDRFLALLHRCEGRLDVVEQGEIPTNFPDPSSVDAPEAAIAQLVAAYPAAEVELLHPADVSYFMQVCRRPGKPVPFVPVIDGDVRRWYQSDSLWQAQHPAFDAASVLVIPGPEAVGGITEVNQPVAGLLGGFEMAVIAGLLADGEQLHDIDRLRRSGPTEPFSGPVAVLAESATVLRRNRAVFNPLLAFAPIADWHLTADESGRLVRTELEVGAVNGAPEKVRLSADGDRVIATLECSPEESVRLAFTLDRLGAIDVIRADQDAWTDAMSDLLLNTLLDGSTPVAELGTQSAVNVTIDADRIRAHGASVGAGVNTTLPDAWLGVAWPAVFAVLGAPELVGGLVDLLHLEHAVHTEAAPPAGDATVRAEVTAISSFAGGCRVQTEATVTALSGETAVLRSALLLRGHSIPKTAAARRLLIEHVDADPFGAAVSRPQRTVAIARATAPRSMEAFASITGDHNPIHRSVLIARLAGFDQPVVHGAWTSALAQRVLCESGDVRPERIRNWTARFLAPVVLGDELEVTAVRSTVIEGSEVIDVHVIAERDDVKVSVMTARAELTAPRTAYLFPGQGIQRAGMGMDSYERCAAARDVWDRADAHTREALGFSILQIVRANPTAVTLPDGVHRHPAGVLHLTQFTQVAMATLASAQVAEMREEGVFDESAVTAGHSVGEYNALAAVAGVLPLESVIDLVFRRGLAMHNLVPRDAAGNSGYRLGVVRPHEVGLDHGALESLIGEVSATAGEVLEIVNFNLRGKQYAVAGTIDSLDALDRELQRRTSPGRKPAFLYVPGIDVPFHSSVLSDGVAEFRAHLDAGLPDRIDPDVLVGRYIPNLVPRPFSLERDFVEEVCEQTSSDALAEVLDHWHAWSMEPSRLTRELLIELLAWQFASPVRWIETQDLLFARACDGGLEVERVIEVGLGTQPTVANLARGTLALPDHRGVRPVVLNCEAERSIVFCDDEDPEAEPEPDPELLNDKEEPALVATPTASPSQSAARSAAAPGDRPATVGDGLRLLLALQLKLRPDQVASTESIDDLVDGVSSRRNQLLMDLGAEFGVSSVDGAQELGVADLESELGVRAPRYRSPGPVLCDAVSSRLGSVLGPMGARVRDVGQRIRDHWGLGDGWVDTVCLLLTADTREGDSTRGGALGRLVPLATTAEELIDAAVILAASDAGVALAAPSVAVDVAVDAAAVLDLEARIAGPDGLLARTARDLIRRTGARPELGNEASEVEADIRASIARLDVLDQEHGHDRAEEVRNIFDPRRHVAFTSWWATARHDMVHLHHVSLRGDIDSDLLDAEAERLTRSASDPSVAAMATWFAHRASDRNDGPAQARFESIAIGTPTTDPSAIDLSADVALITGASPGGIAYESARLMLSAGATVVLTTTTETPERLAQYRELYRLAAAPGAELHVVPANMASFRDIDALVAWLSEESMRPTLLLPFAAGRVSGELPDTGPEAEIAFRTLLIGMERLIGALADEREQAGSGGERVHVVLPGSPNHGTFGGDGVYGEAKAALSATAAKWHSERRRWGRHVSLVLATIGWVRGTGLMGANDALAAPLEAAIGIRTYSAAEMAELLVDACSHQTRTEASIAPVELALDGGLAGINVSEALAGIREPELDSTGATPVNQSNADAPTVAALLSPILIEDQHESAPVTPEVSLDDMVVIVGTGEVGPWGGRVTRFDLEVSGSLAPSSVLELAWWCGLVRWESEGADPGWVDAESAESVPEGEIVQRYGEEVQSRCGVRVFEDDGTLDPAGHDLFTEVFLDEELTLEMGSESDALAVAAADPERVRVRRSADGRWSVTRAAGSSIRVPKRAQLSRRVGAQVPSGFDPCVFGIPAEMAASVDRVSLWNLVATVQAFAGAGIEPEELMSHVHPARVGNTQGSGMGGMNSIRHLHVDTLLGRECPNDLLQEGLGNVIAAYVVQSYVGGYGPMVQPVAACATAAVSIEAGSDAIRLGKADVIVAGGWDDLGLEGVLGFGAMAATAPTDEMEAAGLVPRQFSRANDRRRAGFVEAQGGGTLILARGSVAVAMGLPVLGVVVHAASASDGINTSIPAPGLGALSCTLGGARSPLARSLASHGLSVDDIAVVSKHDTSTAANDPNESFLHQQIASTLGRQPGNPMLAVSQKTVTGHSKGGAAAWQAIGLLQILESGTVPGNRNLETLDESHRDHHAMVYGHRTIEAGETLRAGLLTSLGFGHVSAVVCLAHASVFHAAVDAALSDTEAADYRTRASQRRRDGRQRSLVARHGGPDLYRKRTDRRLGGADDSDARRSAEVEMLISPGARLGDDGVYGTGSA